MRAKQPILPDFLNFFRKLQSRAVWIFCIYSVTTILIAACSGIPTSFGSNLDFNSETPGEPVIDPATTLAGTRIPIPLKPTATSLPVRSPTPTLRPTRTQPAKSPSATPIPPTATATPTSQPIHSDLYFLSNNRLMRWESISQHVSVLAHSVSDYAINQDGSRIALLRAHQVTAGGIEQFDLAILDLKTHRIQLLISSTPRIYLLTISAKGDWIAFQTRAEGGSIRAIPADGSSTATDIGLCIPEDPPHCTELSWSHVDNSVYWSDSRGLWRGMTGGKEAQLAIPDQIKVTDPKGGNSEVPILYRSLSPSPKGRYLLAEVQPVSSNVIWLGLIDAKSARLVEVPHSYGINRLSAQAAWLPNGQLISVRLAVASQQTSMDESKSDMIVEDVWDVIATRNDLLLSAYTYQILLNSLENFSTSNLPATLILDWFTAIGQNLSGLGIHSEDGTGDPYLLITDLETGEAVVEIPRVPGDVESVLWAPDGSGALVIGASGFFFFAAGSENIIELDELFGSEARAFTWTEQPFVNP